MKVLAVLHRPTTDPAGAEKMLHGMLRHLSRQGHVTSVYVTRRRATEFTTDGILHYGPDIAIGDAIDDSDVVLTHLDASNEAFTAAAKVNRSCVVVEHNTFEAHKKFLARQPNVAGVIFNSAWMAESWAGVSPAPSLIVHPPVDPAEYATTPGDRVTMINLFKNGEMFWRLARKTPRTPFLAVKGGYGRQTLSYPVPKNVSIIEPTSDVVNDIYARTRVLLMPSKYESWGRTAIEAASSGIPVLSSNADGLREALGDAGTFRSVVDHKGWSEALRVLLEDEDVYSMYSERSKRRAGEVWEITQRQLDALGPWLENLPSTPTP